MSFSVLFVCTGNICRSPTAELIFRAQVQSLPITVSSAGTFGLSGHEMDTQSALALRELAIDPSGHVARRLNTDLVSSADLILTADSAQRSIILQAEPLVFRHTFTMREFARLGAAFPMLESDITSDTLRARAAQVAGQRGVIEPGPPGSDDVGDPLGRGLVVARRTVAVINTAISGVLHALGVRPMISAAPT